jgi:transposase InsO family protein
MLMKCIPTQQGKEFLLEIHASIYGHHATPRSLVGKAFRQDFYWLTALRNAEELVRTCKGCQFYAWQTHLLAQALWTIPLTWPFAVWGLDMVGPRKKAPGDFTRLLIAVDKFTKWIEAKLIIKPSSQEAVKFFLDIIYRFGVPNTIITDNGTNFMGKKFLDFADRYGMKIDWASVGHPRTNGQVERANGMVL